MTRSGLRSPCWAPIWAETSASMMPSTRTRRASRSKSTSPSIPRLRNNSKRSILCLTTVVLLGWVWHFRSRMTRWSAFCQPPNSYTTSWDSTALDFTQNLEEATDAITLGCRHSWLESEGFSLSAANADVQELPATLYH